MKNRLMYFLATIITIVLGLLSRKFMFVFPDAIAPFIGDMLWASMVYFGIGFIFPKLQANKLFVVAIIFSYLIEFSQLYQAQWILNVRATTIGGLMLGHGFLFKDLIAYLIGIALAWIVGKFLLVECKSNQY